MKSFEAILRQMTDTDKVMQMLRQIMNECDPEYAKVETTFVNGIQTLRHAIGHDKQILLSKIIKAENERVIADLLYLTLLGMNQNLLCSHDLDQKRFLYEDYEDIHKESLINGFPVAHKADKAWHELSDSLTIPHRDLMCPITAYYCYWETVAHKLAHYFGFWLGDKIFPWTLAEYIADQTVTRQYALNLQDYLQGLSQILCKLQ